MRIHPATGLAIVLSASVLGARDVAADSWRVPRHDAARSGASAGAVPMASPNVAWRAYQGGEPNDKNVHFGLGGPSTVVTSAGGRFVARNMVTQSVLWKSPMLGAGSVVQFADLNGDQKKEVVVQTAQQAHVLDGATGALLWSSPPDEIQIMGAVHVRDMDGDGLPDVYLDNGIGAKYGTTIAAAFSFAGGAGHKIWSLPITTQPIMVNAGEDVLADLDGDGIPEILLASSLAVLVVSGKDGSTIATLTPPTPPGEDYPYFEATGLATELDGQPGKEVLMIERNSIPSQWTRPGLAAYRLDVSTGQSQMLWAVSTASYDAALIATGDEPSDLDGDGIDEVIMSYRIGTVWQTNVLNGATGHLLASVPDSRFEGTADLDGVPGKELIVSTVAGLTTFSFANDMLVPIGSPLPGVRMISMVDPSLDGAFFVNRRAGVVQGPGNHPMLLAGVPLGSPGPFDRVDSFDSLQGFEVLPNGGSSALQQVGSYTPPAGKITGAIKADFATRPYPQVAVGTSAGLVVVLNQHLTPTNGAIWLNGDPLGAFVGGAFDPDPSLVAHDNSGPFVLFPTTFLGAVAADVRFASWILPPIPRWASDNLSAPSIIDLDGVTSVVGIEDHAIVARRSDTGSQLGSVTLPLGSIRGNPLPLRVAGQANHFVGIDWLVAGSHQVAQTKVDFATQSIAWSSAPMLWAGFFGSSVADLDNDGTDEWYTMEFDKLYRRSADTGSLATIGNYPGLAYSMPILAPFQGSSGDILLQNGWGPPSLVGADGTPLWAPAPDGPAENGVSGARVLCNGIPKFIGPDLDSSHLHSYDGPTGTLSVEKVYAGGHAYATEQDALAAGEHPGVMSDVNAVADLAGAPAAFAGSSDGFLYAVDPCTLELRWAANIGVSIGEPIVADVDGDGDDEIVVAGSDGFVYGLDKALFPAPILSLGGDQGVDVEKVAAGASVTVTWPSVSGAQGYEYALVGPDEKAVGTPAYKPTNGTSATVSLDGALASRPYRVAIRATSASGPGLEGFSKPIAIDDLTNPTSTVTATDGPTLALTVDGSDDVSLDHYELLVHAGATAPAVVDDGLMKDKHDTKNLVWAADKSVWGSDVILEVAVFDSAGLKSQSTLTAHVATDGSVTTSPGGQVPLEPVSSDPPVSASPPATPQGDAALAGCAANCSVGAPNTSGGWAYASLLLGASLLRRYGRRALRAGK